MANNRIYVKCRCGEERFLAKTLGGGYYMRADTAEKFEDWLDEHAFCGGTEDNFDLTYECSRDWTPTPDQPSTVSEVKHES
jgi:hypothetical protein